VAEHKSLTERAMRKRREAYVERTCKRPAILAPMFERQADELLALADPPDVGPGGEVVREQTPGLGTKRSYIRETLTQDADRTAEDASIPRVLGRSAVTSGKRSHRTRTERPKMRASSALICCYNRALMPLRSPSTRRKAFKPGTVWKRCWRISWLWRMRHPCG